MSKIKLETLTAVHVGSGEKLQYKTEFISNGDDIYVIDEYKILELIGTEHIREWLTSIGEDGNIVQLIKRFAPQAKPADYSTRILALYASVNDGDTLKECIHDGCGRPYIPGSSIKGAIRTAILAEEVETAQISENELKDKYNKYTAENIEKRLFGTDPNRDLFRFLQIGDAFFEPGCEAALRMVMYLNITQRQDLVTTQDRKPQLAEVIWDGESEFRMNINHRGYNLARQGTIVNGSTYKVRELPVWLASEKALLQTCNKHTIRLLEREIEFWESVSEELTGADDYIDKLKKMLDYAKDCVGKAACVLRLGHAVGWDFITGGWSRRFKCFDGGYNSIVDATRPGNARYSQYDFPKSRRLDADEGDMLGFVRLTLVD